jgi:hypothetical protein
VVWMLNGSWEAMKVWYLLTVSTAEQLQSGNVRLRPRKCARDCFASKNVTGRRHC